MVPASDPYVVPKFAVAPTNSDSTPVNASQRIAARPEPSASHDGSGCRRRGAISNTSASAVTTSAIASGQRAMVNAEPQPAALASVDPATSRTAAPSVATPAVSISTAATPYLRSGGRSRSTP